MHKRVFSVIAAVAAAVLKGSSAFAMSWTFNGSQIISDDNSSIKITNAVLANGDELTVKGGNGTNCGGLDEIDFDVVKDQDGNLLRIVSMAGNQGATFWKSNYPKCVKLPKDLKAVPESLFVKLTTFQKIVIPEGCEAIGQKAFQAMADLEEVVLPSSLKSIGSQAFDQSANVSFRTTSGAPLTSLTTEYFPDLESIGTAAFQANPTIVSVDFTGHKHLQVVGNSAFNACANLQTAVIDGCEGMGVRSSVFANCPELVSVTFGPNVYMFGDLNNAGTPKQAMSVLGNNPKLTEVRIQGIPYGMTTIYFNWWLWQSTNAGDYTLRLYVKDSAEGTNWRNSYYTQSSKLTPWDNLTAEQQKKYTDRFPGEELPSGLMLGAKNYGYCENQWIFYVKDEGPAKAVLKIQSQFGDTEIGMRSVGTDPSPTYGVCELSVGEALTCSIGQYSTAWLSDSATGKRAGVLYETTGAVLEKKNGDSYEYVTSYVGREIEVTLPDASEYRLSWQFAVVGYRPEARLGCVSGTEDMLGSIVTVGEPDYVDGHGNFWLSTNSVTYRVDLVEGATFGRWMWDLPEEQATSRIVSLPVTNDFSVIAYVRANKWRYIPGEESRSNDNREVSIDGRLTDGYWNLAATVGPDGKMAIGWTDGAASSWSAQYNRGSPLSADSIVDLTLPIESAHSITGLSSYCFCYNQTSPMEELRLPSTVKTLGPNAFYNNKTLKTIVFASDVEIDETACRSVPEGQQLWQVPPTENWQRFVSEKVTRWSRLTDAQRAKWTGEGRPKGLIKGFGQWIRYTKDLGFSLIIR